MLKRAGKLDESEVVTEEEFKKRVGEILSKQGVEKPVILVDVPVAPKSLSHLIVPGALDRWQNPIQKGPSARRPDAIILCGVGGRNGGRWSAGPVFGSAEYLGSVSPIERMEAFPVQTEGRCAFHPAESWTKQATARSGEQAVHAEHVNGVGKLLHGFEVCVIISQHSRGKGRRSEANGGSVLRWALALMASGGLSGGRGRTNVC